MICAVSELLNISATAVLILILLDCSSLILDLDSACLIAIHPDCIYQYLVVSYFLYHIGEIVLTNPWIEVVFHPFLRLLVITLIADQYIPLCDWAAIIPPVWESIVMTTIFCTCPQAVLADVPGDPFCSCSKWNVFP